MLKKYTTGYMPMSELVFLIYGIAPAMPIIGIQKWSPHYKDSWQQQSCAVFWFPFTPVWFQRPTEADDRICQIFKATSTHCLMTCRFVHVDSGSRQMGSRRPRKESSREANCIRGGKAGVCHSTAFGRVRWTERGPKS